jgi:ribosomal protein S14
MARKALVVKQQKLSKIREKYLEIEKNKKWSKLSWEEKYKLYRKYKGKTRYYNRCKVCGRARAYNRELGLCRVCIRKYGRE